MIGARVKDADGREGTVTATRLRRGATEWRVHYDDDHTEWQLLRDCAVVQAAKITPDGDITRE